jgi:hypothetical protein
MLEIQGWICGGETLIGGFWLLGSRDLLAREWEPFLDAATFCTHSVHE